MTLHARLALLSSIAAFLLLSACSGQQQGGERPPTEVSVITVIPERMALMTELPGRLEASRVAQVRARVAGIVLKREFVEGSEVKAGQLLFRIDPAPYQAALNSAKASQAKAEANLTQATLKLNRYEPLVKISAVSKQEFDDASAMQKQAAADVASAKAAVVTAALNLGYASVRAPISGRIGRALVTEGALVGQGEATQLALIQQVDKLFVNLTQSSAEVMQLQSALRDGRFKGASKDEAKVQLVLEDDSVYAHEGKLLFSDITVDESTGSISLRASFSNPDRMLMPGMFVRARLQQAVDEEAIAVPQQAVQRTTDGASVLVVDAENKVVVRRVKTRASRDDKWIVSEGLKSGERVVVEGLQKIRPGMVVNPVNWKKTEKTTVPNAPPAANAGASVSVSASASASVPAASPAK